MKILAIESSGLVASVAVTTENELISEYTVDYKKTHSQTLLPMIDEIKKMTELNLEELDAVAISNGPGSFTGLRIGSATAKGLAMALEIPMVEVSSLEGMAYNAYGLDLLICPIMDARRDQVYSAIYKFVRNTKEKAFAYELETVLSPVAFGIDELSDKINERGEAVMFVGDGCDVYKEKIASLLKVPYTFAPAGMNKQRAGSVALAAVKYFKEGKTVLADDSCPVYLRLSQAERELLERQKNQ